MVLNCSVNEVDGVIDILTYSRPKTVFM